MSVVSVQDVSGGAPVAVEGTELPLWGMEIDVERAKAELRELGQAGAAGGSSKVDDFMSGVGLGAFQEQLKDLRLSAALLAFILCLRQCCPIGMQLRIHITWKNSNQPILVARSSDKLFTATTQRKSRFGSAMCLAQRHSRIFNTIMQPA